MKTTFTTKLAAVTLAVIFLVPDALATARSIHGLHGQLQPKADGTVVFDLQPVKETPRVPETKENSFKPKVKSIKTRTASKGLTVFAKEQVAYLGSHQKDPLNLPIDDYFTFELPKIEEGQKAYLSYQVKSQSGLEFIPFSVNEEVVYSGLEVKATKPPKTLKIELNPYLLKKGHNQIRFNAPLGLQDPVEISNVQLSFSDKSHSDALNATYEVPELSSQPIAFKDASGLSSLQLGVLHMPSVPNQIQNITKGAFGYRLASKTDDTVSVRIPVNSGFVTQEQQWKSVQLFFFDREHRSWEPAPALEADPGAGTIGGQLPGNTTYFAGMISSPQMPEANAFAPTAMSGIEGANPAEGMNLIQPPAISQTGEANINYPLDIPKGRNGLTPRLTLNYNSDKTSGWLGVGWDLSVPAVSVDSRWGVPEFDSEVETEVYTLNGQQLSMSGKFKANRDLVARSEDDINFFEKTRRSFKELKRRETSPSSYFWIETTNDNTKYYYGTSDGQAVDPTAVLKDGEGNIVRWYLKKVIDKWDNSIIYNYSLHQSEGEPGSSIEAGAQQLVLSSIQYTNHEGTAFEAGKYTIEFASEHNRTDKTVSFKSGVKEVTSALLEDITIKYDGTQIKRFHFTYSNSATDKTFLTDLEEFRGSSLFYSHQFEYTGTSGTIGYEFADEIAMPNVKVGTFSNVPNAIDYIASIAAPVIKPSLLGTATSRGSRVGGSLGIGFMPSWIPFQSKTFTISGFMGSTKNKTADFTGTQDFNADGIPDLMFKLPNRTMYFPVTIDDNGNFSVGNFRNISFNSKLNFIKTKSRNYGYDFVAPKSLFYFGENWIESIAESTNRFVDFNADGIPDVLEPNHGRDLISFGRLDGFGNLTFAGSSEITPNPVKTGQAIVKKETTPSTIKDFEVVKSWVAPFDGSIDYVGDAILALSSDPNLPMGHVEVAVQHNSALVFPFTTVNSSTSAVDASGQILNTEEGDTVLFRVRAGQDGKRDLLIWNPSISYQGLSKIDENNVDYADSDYESAHILSGGSVSFKGRRDLNISFPDFPSGLIFTDEVEFIIHLEVTDSITGNSILSEDFVYKITENPTMILDNFVGQTTGHQASALEDVDAAPLGLSESDDCNIRFEMRSTSNVNWKSIEWRPRVEYVDNGCVNRDEVFYPAPFVSTFNRVNRMESPYNCANQYPGKNLMVKLDMNVTLADLNGIFNSFTKAPNDIKLNFVVKTQGKFLGKKEFTIQNNASSVSALNSSVNEILFGEPDLVNQRLYCGFYAEYDALGSFISSHLGTKFNVDLKSENGGVYSLETGLDNDLNVFSKDPTELNDLLLHWGRFVWSADNKNPINNDELQSPSYAAAMQNDLSNNTTFDASSVAGLDGNALNPMNQKFFPLGAHREEAQIDQRGYIKSKSQIGEGLFVLDQWSLMGMHIGAYRDGFVAPGKFGEPEDEGERLPAPITIGTYNAYGISVFQRELSRAITIGPGLFPNSNTVNASNYKAEKLTYLMDLNGDSYLDILDNRDGEKKLSFTNTLGGHKNPIDAIAPGYDKIEEVENARSNRVVNGSFINDEVAYLQQNPLSTGSKSFGTSTNRGLWVDVNGDALPDFVRKTGSGVDISLNSGRGMEGEVATSNILNVVRRNNTNWAISAGLEVLNNMNSKGGMSFSVGLGVNFNSSTTDIFFKDINGDNLNDLISITSPVSMDVFLNTGTSFEFCGDCDVNSFLSTYAEGGDIFVEMSKSFGFSGSVAGTGAGTIAPFLKISGSLNGALHFSINEIISQLKDINGDGVPDLLKADGRKLKIYLNHVSAPILLSKVTNPLKGSFTLEYDRIGNKRGFYDVKIQKHDSPANEPILWDMPTSKWALSAVVLNDGYNLNGNGANDGPDSYRLEYKYDGGIRDRRNREFLGFGRTQVIKPFYLETKIVSTDYAQYLSAYPENPCSCECEFESESEVKQYNSEVVDYFKPIDLSRKEINKLWYLSGMVENRQTQFHREILINDATVTLPAPGHPGYNICLNIAQQNLLPAQVSLLEKTKYDYAFGEVDMSNENPGRLIMEGDEPSPFNFEVLEESGSIFPAVLASNHISVPVKEEPKKIHAIQYNLTYDDYFNVIQYDLGGFNGETTITSNIVATVTKNRVDTVMQRLIWNQLVSGNTGLSELIDPLTNQRAWVVPSHISGYDNDTVYMPIDNSTNPCSTQGSDPFDPDYVWAVHRKEVTETIDITEDTYSTPYISALIAKMAYFDPTVANNQTNLLKSHLIFSGSDLAQDLVRASKVLNLKSANEPRTIKLYSFIEPTTDKDDILDDGLNDEISGEVELDYDKYGNIINMQGAENHDGQKLEVDFVYDSEVHQFIEEVNNQSYNYSSCYKYDFATGNLLFTKDINGNPMRYTYDGFYRLEKVWGPNELIAGGSTAAPAIEFEYHPEGHSPAQGPLNRIPYAISRHNTASPASQPPGEDNNIDCGSLPDMSEHNSMPSLLSTVVFIDGQGRTIWTKKDVGKQVGSVNSRHRLLSGLTEYDQLWRPIAHGYADIEPTSQPQGKVNTQYISNNTAAATLMAYDDYDRLTEVLNPREDGGAHDSVDYKYGWSDELNSSEAFFYTQTRIPDKDYALADVESKSRVFINTLRQKVGLIQYDDVTAAITAIAQDGLGQTLSTTDPIGEQTTFEYDLMGRMKKEVHPDRGESKFSFDQAGNLIKVVTPATGSGGINMEYDHTRLIKKMVPHNPYVANVNYYYGELNDGKNGAGRVTRVLQGTNYADTYYEYDALGHVTREEKKLHIPAVGRQDFVTQFGYDSYGRILSMNYPDGDIVNYSYNGMGDLESITRGGGSDNIISGILYDGRNNIQRIDYGNGAESQFTTSDITDRLTNVSLRESDNSQITDKDFFYNQRGLVSKIENTPVTASSNSTDMGGDYTVNYDYDGMNRLAGVPASSFVDHQNGGINASYSMSVTYNLAGGITSKAETLGGSTSTDNYVYNTNKPHQLASTSAPLVPFGPPDIGALDFNYNTSGSLISVSYPNASPSGKGFFCWDTEQQLRASLTGEVLPAHYLYDHNGARLMKANLNYASGGYNGNQSNGNYGLNPYQVYVNPYYNARHFSDLVEISKHYYMGSQRVVSRLKRDSFEPITVNTELEDWYEIPFSQMRGAERDLWQSLLCLGLTDQGGGTPGEGPGLGEPGEGGEGGESSGGNKGFEMNSLVGFQNVPELGGGTQSGVSYWYHASYLGSTEWITNASGNAHQYFFYNPWGGLLQERYAYPAEFKTDWKFNGKEFDPETGNYYYGARYYDPVIWKWLSVDPLATQFPWQTPYAFTDNNPVNLIDPTGMSATCPTCPEDEEYDFFRNSPNEYEYDAEEGEVTRQGGELGEVTVVDGQPSNGTAQDNTNIALNDLLRNSLSDHVYIEGGSVADRTRQANAVDKWMAKNVDPKGVETIQSALKIRPRAPDADNMLPTWIEGLTDFFDGPDYKPSGDSVIIKFPGESEPKVRSILTPGGGIGGARKTPPTAKDSLKHKIVE